MAIRILDAIPQSTDVAGETLRAARHAGIEVCYCINAPIINSLFIHAYIRDLQKSVMPAPTTPCPGQRTKLLPEAAVLP